MAKKYYRKNKNSKFEKSQKTHAKLIVQNQAKSFYHTYCVVEQKRLNRMLSGLEKKKLYQNALYRANNL